MLFVFVCVCVCVCVIYKIPFECTLYPGTSVDWNSNRVNQNIIVLHKYDCFVFDFCLHYLSWEVARIVWIGFEKNVNNDKCLLNLLSKDLIKHVLSLLGTRRNMIPDSTICL